MYLLSLLSLVVGTLATVREPVSDQVPLDNATEAEPHAIKTGYRHIDAASIYRNEVSMVFVL
ncbi:hypothetical protein E4T42_07350 [Aureobasidium subglaciale]|nr:hypothetical protein E4T42_07350 [Aureobasidium subglaciale]